MKLMFKSKYFAWHGYTVYAVKSDLLCHFCRSLKQGKEVYQFMRRCVCTHPINTHKYVTYFSSSTTAQAVVGIVADE